MGTLGVSTVVKTETNSVFKVVFEKLSKPLHDLFENPITVYGIRCFIEAESSVPVDSCVISDISSNEQTVDHLIALLVKNQVTPVHLYDIVEDYIVQ